MLQDYKHLASKRSSRYPNKTKKPFLIRILIIVFLVTSLVWFLTFQAEKTQKMQFSFYQSGKIQYDFSNFSEASQPELLKYLLDKSGITSVQSNVDKIPPNAMSRKSAISINPENTPTITGTTIENTVITTPSINNPLVTDNNHLVIASTTDSKVIKEVILHSIKNKKNNEAKEVRKVKQGSEFKQSSDFKQDSQFKESSEGNEKKETNQLTQKNLVNKPDKELSPQQTQPSSIQFNNKITPIQQSSRWHSIIIEPGHTLNQMAVELKLSQKDIGLLLIAAKKHRRQLVLRPGRQIRFKLSYPARELQLISYISGSKNRFELRRQRRGFSGHTYPLNFNPLLVRLSATVNSSLFNSSSKNEIPDSLLLQLAAIFNWDIDFTSELNKGDSFTLLHEQYSNEHQNIHGTIVAASMTIKGKTLFAFRYTNPRGHTAWYNQNAEILKKRFLRTPLRLTHNDSNSSKLQVQKNNRISISYNSIEGTPVKTTASGTIIYMGTKKQYGKTVIVRHQKGYSTLYGHLSRFRQHLRSGRKVSQGQVIAYVGKTGAANNAKLHYELRLRGKHLNPLNNNNPRQRKISRRWRKDFLKKSAVLLRKLNKQ